jgi:hypothetical protein
MKTFLEHIDYGLFEGKHVPLERPMVDVTEDDDKKVNVPKKGGPKKFYVYVKDGEKTKKVTFGAKDGGANLSVKIDDPKARKAFADRHNCDTANDKLSARYWSCRLPYYAKDLGLKGGGNFFW